MSLTFCLDWFRQIRQIAINKARDFNLFEPSVNNADAHEQEFQLKNGRIATRLYFILLLSIVLALSLILRLTIDTKTVLVKKPTRLDYEKLLLTPEAKNLNCRCTNIAIPYNQTIQLEVFLHPLCRSNYSTQWEWLTDGYQDPILTQTHFNFRQRFFSQMLLAERLCLAAQKTVIDGLISFYGTSLISTQLLPIDLLTSQMQSLKNVFIANLADNFLLTIDIISMVVQNNQLLTADFTNTELFAASHNATKASNRPVIYDNCSCNAFDTSSCTTMTILVSASFDPLNITIESLFGIMAACYNIESLRKSHLALFFNQTAIDIIVTKLDMIGPEWYENVDFIEALNISELSAHRINTSIENLLADLFVEEWRLDVTFDQYYNACASELCWYQMSTNRSYFYIASFILGLIGGLGTVLRFLLPPFVKFLRRKSKPRRVITGNIDFLFSQNE